MSSETLPNRGLPQVAIKSPNKYTPDFWVNKPHPAFGFLEIQVRDRLHRGWLQFLPPQGFLIFGRDLGAAHIYVGHPTISNQHAVAAWDVRDGKCYLLDLESEHGTFVNDQVIEHSVPCELRPGANVRFGQSAHIYIFSKLPEELVDPNQEAPVIDRSLDTRTEASQPRYDERFQNRFESRPEPRLDYDRPPPFDRPPSDRDHRGPLPDMDRRGAPPDMDRRGAPPDMDRRGAPPDMDRRGAPPDMDRRGAPPDMDRREPPPDMDRRRLPDMDRRRLPDMDRHGLPPPDMDRRVPPPERWSPPDRHFEGRPPDGQGRGRPDRYDDRGRFDSQRTPPHHMGQGPRPPQHGGRPPHMGPGPRSPRGGRRSPRGRGRPGNFR